MKKHFFHHDINTKYQPINVHQICTDPNGRYIIIDIEIYGFMTTLCNVYGPNDDN